MNRWEGVLAALLVAITSQTARAELVDGVVAVVNGDPILLSEVLERPGLVLPPGDDPATVERRHKTLQRAVEEAVTDHLVEKQCAEEGISPTAVEVDNAIEDVQHSNGNIDRATLEKALAAQGLTMPLYREMLTRQLCQMKLLESKVKAHITVTDDDIRLLFSQMTADAKSSRELKLRDIFVSSEGGMDHARTRIEDARKRILAGEDFVKVAKETGGPLASNGGDLGWIKEEDLAPALKPVLKLKKGDISDIIETPEGLHFLKVEDDRVVSSAKSFSDMRDEIRQRLVRERMGKATEVYLDDLRKGAEIEYRVP